MAGGVGLHTQKEDLCDSGVKAMVRKLPQVGAQKCLSIPSNARHGDAGLGNHHAQFWLYVVLFNLYCAMIISFGIRIFDLCCYKLKVYNLFYRSL